MSLAPIVLFTYNRPEHTKRTLIALSENDLAEESELIVYCDGPKPNADTYEIDRINKVRNIVKAKKWCKEITIIESTINKGLALSIIQGVTEMVNRFGKIIVLEDDIVTAKGFLRYMNQALCLYEENKRVMHISSFIPYTNGYYKLPQSFFLRFMSCWGWATWKDRWEQYNPNTQWLYQQINTPVVLNQFNLDGAIRFHEQLEDNIHGRKRTWAINWYTTIFLNNGLCLYPGQSLSINIGEDGSGINSVKKEEKRVIGELENIRKIKLKESKIGRAYLKRYYRYGNDASMKRILKLKLGLLKHKLLG